jgi:uncharacterized phage protein gp47/JayE
VTTYGVTPAGFKVKPLAAILLDMQTQVQNTIDPNFDLSPATPDGQMLGIVANGYASLWELLQIAFNQFNREDVEGAGLDNLGDLTGTPRETSSYTQVYATLTLAAGTYAAESLVANVAGVPSLTFSNVGQVTSIGGATAGVLMQATTIGPTPSVNPGQLTVITTPVAGWTAITNPGGQTQLGTLAELDPAYAARQALEVTAEGSCNPSATAAAIENLGAAQVPPQPLIATVVENTTAFTQTISGLLLPPHSYSCVIYDGGSGWALGAGQPLIAAVVYANKPEGIAPIGNTPNVVIDPVLGPQNVPFTVPVGRPLFVTVTVVPRVGVSFAALAAAIQNALVAAAVAPTLLGGTPPTGQLAPGQSVVGSQLEAVASGVPGTFDVQALAFGFAANPTNTAPLPVIAAQVATILSATVATNVLVLEGTYP